MEWAIGGIMGIGALLYCILAMSGSDKQDNLKGFRLKLFAMCLVWPATMIILACIIIWKAIFGPKTEASISPLTERAGSILPRLIF